MQITYISPAYPRYLQRIKAGRGCMVVIERKNDSKGVPFFWLLKVNGRDIVSSVAPFLVDGADPFTAESGFPGYVRMKIVQEFEDGLQDADYQLLLGDPLFIESAKEADWPTKNHLSAQGEISAF